MFSTVCAMPCGRYTPRYRVGLRAVHNRRPAFVAAAGKGFGSKPTGSTKTPKRQQRSSTSASDKDTTPDGKTVTTASTPPMSADITEKLQPADRQQLAEAAQRSVGSLLDSMDDTLGAPGVKVAAADSSVKASASMGEASVSPSTRAASLPVHKADDGSSEASPMPTKAAGGTGSEETPVLQTAPRAAAEPLAQAAKPAQGAPAEQAVTSMAAAGKAASKATKSPEVGTAEYIAGIVAQEPAAAAEPGLAADAAATPVPKAAAASSTAAAIAAASPSIPTPAATSTPGTRAPEVASTPSTRESTAARSSSPQPAGNTAKPAAAAAVADTKQSSAAAGSAGWNALADADNVGGVVLQTVSSLLCGALMVIEYGFVSFRRMQMSSVWQEVVSDTRKLGQRGELLLAAQLGLIGMIVVAPTPLESLMTVAGVGLLAAGAYMVYDAQQQLGRNLTPLAEPRPEHSLITSGVYGMVRHPMYGALTMLGLGLAAVTDDGLRFFLAGLLLLTLDRKATLEESFLEERYGEEYRVYRSRTKKLFPFIY